LIERVCIFIYWAALGEREREKRQSIGDKEQLLIDIVSVAVTLISSLFPLAGVFGKRPTLRRFFLLSAQTRQ
jgi:hypothetical protein